MKAFRLFDLKVKVGTEKVQDGVLSKDEFNSLFECKQGQPALLYSFWFFDEVAHNKNTVQGKLPVGDAAHWIHGHFQDVDEQALEEELATASATYVPGYTGFQTLWSVL